MVLDLKYIYLKRTSLSELSSSTRRLNAFENFQIMPVTIAGCRIPLLEYIEKDM